MDMLGNSNLWDEPDMVLSYIVTMLVSTMGVEVDVTLMTRGAVISGTLISEGVYLQKLTDTLMEKVQFTNQDVPEEAREALKLVLDVRDMSEFNPWICAGGRRGPGGDTMQWTILGGSAAYADVLALEGPVGCIWRGSD